nr:MFS transporter [Flaviflexus huanghaiensis]
MPSLIYSIGNGALQPVVVLAALDIGFSDAGASAVLGVAGVVGVLTAPLLGRVITRLGDRLSLIVASILALAALGIALSAMFVPGTAYATGAFMIGIALIAVSLNVWMLARQTYIADALPGEWRGRGLATLGGMLRLGVLVGPLVSTALIALWGLESIFVMNAVTVALALALIVRYLAPLPSREPVTRETPTAHSPDAHPGGVTRPDLRATAIAGLGVTTLMVLRSNKNVIIPLWGATLGLDNAIIALAFAVSALIDTAMFYPGGRLSDRRGRLWGLVPSLTVMSASIVLMVLWADPLGFFLGSALLGLGNGFGSGILMTIGADLSPSTKRANFLGTWQAISNSGMAAGPFVVSGMTAFIGISAALWATAGIGIFGALWFRALLPATYLRLGLGLNGMPLQQEFERPTETGSPRDT